MFGGGVTVLATHSIRQFPLHFPSRASPCAIRFRTSSTNFRRLLTETSRVSVIADPKQRVFVFPYSFYSRISLWK